MEFEDVIKKSKIDIKDARNFISKIKNCSDLNELELKWKCCLVCIEKSWNKMKCLNNVSPKFTKIRSEYWNTKRGDPLLAYVLHAKNSDQHTIYDIAEKYGGKIKIGAGRGGVALRKLGITSDGKFFSDHEGELVIYIKPGELKLKKVYDRGKWYKIPEEHLGKPIGEPNPLLVAELATQWHENYIFEMEQVMRDTDIQPPSI